MLSSGWKPPEHSAELEHSAVRAMGYGTQLLGPRGPTKALQDPLELHMEEPLAQTCSSAKARAL